MPQGLQVAISDFDNQIRMISLDLADHSLDCMVFRTLDVNFHESHPLSLWKQTVETSRPDTDRLSASLDRPQ